MVKTKGRSQNLDPVKRFEASPRAGVDASFKTPIDAVIFLQESFGGGFGEPDWCRADLTSTGGGENDLVVDFLELFCARFEFKAKEG